MLNPLLSLPQHVLDAVFSHLSPPALAVSSLTCSAWRDLPYEHLPCKLVVAAGAQAEGILAAGLHRCRNLHTIAVSSSKDPIWPRFAAALAQQQLPSLRELHIQHSSQTDAAHLEQLRTILQVQGPQCVLHLALTDTTSLQALLPMLPLRGLASLELNVPYLAEGALQLLLHAASVQAAALCSSSNMQPSASDFLQQWKPQLTQQGVLKIGLWVCCWGGCSGLLLSDAVALHGKLQQLPCCTMTGCESVNITNSNDLAALSQLQGLEALGINFVTVTDKSQPQQQLVPHSMQEAATVAVDASMDQPMAIADADSSSASSGGSAEVLRVLTSLSSSLKQLSIRSSPAGGWGKSGATPASTPPKQQLQQLFLQQQNPHQPAPQQNPLAALTGLTKLSLLKDWCRPALAVSPIAALTLLQELALERHGLQHPAELTCLSTLTDLRVLSIVLTATADDLVESVQEGSWQLAGPAAGPAHWLQPQQQACAAMMDRLSLLHVEDQDSMGAAGMEWGTDDEMVTCSCCCSRRPGVEAGAGSSGAGAGWGGSEAPGAAAVVELLQEVVTCPVLGGAGSPVLLDWSWLSRLQQLETAWLQVPHVDLSCLPSSLVELDAQQPHDLTRVSITCCNSRGIDLPRLRRMVLPQLLQPAVQPDAIMADPTSMLAADQVAGSSMQSDGSDDGSQVNCASCSESFDEGDLQLQRHYEAALLLSVAQGCPDLKELELVQWQPPSTAVLAAAQVLKWLNMLSVVGPEGCADLLQQQVQAVRAQHNLRPVHVDLAEPLVLSSYPWSSVLARR